MIRTFADKDTEALFNDEPQRRIPADVQNVALRKLVHLSRATTLTDLADVPGNRLEKLKGNREGQWSIRVNSQWRVCFSWDTPDSYQVEIVDYH